YDGYGNSIRKVMERKTDNDGILGVVADIIKVQKQYEVAIETALGGTIQNIVTDNEQTAKGLIAYLKENKFGRATFLPLSSISGRNTLEKDACLNEKGVVGIASRLVRVSFEYENLVNYLLGRILVVDNIDNALAIARKYKYSLRIVTLEGEQLNPGGSMTGGAFRNSSNLLGRRREIEELKASAAQISDSLDKLKGELADTRKKLASIREDNEAAGKSMREQQIAYNTAQMNYKQASQKRDEIIASYQESASEAAKLDKQIEDIRGGLSDVTSSLASLDDKNTLAQEKAAELNSRLE
ncbi:MAG TPA: chromosome segregation protein SMC, partial [Bacteroides sp.]|nr:chromosome segregation protein SMC [Bacteroides sp.]